MLDDFIFRMSHRNTASPSPRSGSETVSRSASASKKILIDNCIRRIAIDPSAALGSFYDARTESVVGKLSLDKNTIKNIPQQQDIECVVMKADTFNSEELFHKIGIYEESWLNSILNIVPAAGIASILNYSFPKSKNIRFLYYYYSSEEQSIFPVKNTVIAAIPKANPDIAATHVISVIKLGVQVLVVLQLSPDNGSNLDSLLEDIVQRLRKNRFQISNDDKSRLDRITVTKVFSNISTLNNISTLADICQKITEIKPHIHCHRPLEFTLRTIKWFYPLYPNQKAQYTPLEPDVIKMIKQYLDSLSSQIKQLKTSLNSEEKRLNKQYDALRQRVADVEAMYQAEIEGIGHLVIQIRSGLITEQESVIKKLSDRYKELLKNNIDPIIERLESLGKKVKLINKLDEENIKYLNMELYSIHQSDDLSTIFQKLCTHGKPQLIFCSTDDLRDQNSSTWHHQHMEWMQQREIDSELTLVYADFTYTSYPLSTAKILFIKSIDDVGKQSELSALLKPKAMPSHKQQSKNEEDVFASSWSPQLPCGKTTLTTEDQLEYGKEKPNSFKLPIQPTSQINLLEKKHCLVSSRSRSIKYVNILLLGESGVGKSTFINALVNYLAFETLEQARSNQPIVAIPVSFLMTVGDNFEERTVQFGAKDPNEDHDHPSQSVTQHCRSYVFPIGTQTKLRIIDTPGMGDTRGLEQDDRNMEHILSFINNLPHLNAICILLKPNESKLKVVFRSYFTRFLNFLGENARNNIVFCFTNTRATFYAPPGDTAPLLKKMINSLSIKDIPFGKRNTFCFDSKSFRYLVALQNGIPFDTVQEAEYQQSWTKSSTVSKNLIQFICGEFEPYPQNQWQSIEHAQFSINQLIRPMLETMRNILRNINLLKGNSSKLLIKVCPIVVSQSSALCYKCPRIPQRFSDFWILPDAVHTFSNECKDCDCSKEKHVDVEYKLDYQLIEYEDAQSFENMKWNLEQLRMAILEFSQFYAYIIDTLKQNDPILSALKQIIAEEDQIRSEKGD
jgi:GTP-binding protein EngB required for normal cell division